MSNLILLPGQEKQNYVIGRHARATKMVDSVLCKQGEARWEATRALWFMIYPDARQDHLDAVLEATQLRSTTLDREGYGRTRQTLGIAYGERGNKNTNRRLLAVLPETLKDFLRRFDPDHLRDCKGEEYRKNWRKVYRHFREYTVAEKI